MKKWGGGHTLEPKKFNELLRRVNDDQKAYEEIYTYFQPKIVSYLARHYKNFSLAEDVVQDFFFKKLPTINTTEYIKFPLTWMRHACEKLLQTELRREKRKTTVEFNNSSMEKEVVSAIDEEIFAERHNSDDYFDTLLKAGIDIDCVDAFRKLGKNVVEIFIMRHCEGYSDEEIAATLNIKGNNLRVIAHRGKKILKILLNCVTILLFFQSIW
jgi:RNA polymerase sigma factor (sigma-70 family)